MTILDRNLEILCARSPELAARIDGCVPRAGFVVLAATSGAFTLSVDTRLEASAEDPEGEAEQLVTHFVERAAQVGATRMALFGLGVHTLRYMHRFEGDLLIIEPSLEICRIVLERIDLSRSLERSELICSSDPSQALMSSVFANHEERGLFLSHPATRRRNQKLHDELARGFHPGGTSQPLNIAVIPPLYGGSLPIAQSCASALRGLGHYVRDIDLTAFWPAYESLLKTLADPRVASLGESLRAGLVRLIGESLLASFQLDPPDLVFAVAQAPLDPEVLDRMGAMGITRAFWFCEDFRVMTYWESFATSYDTIFHVQPADFSEPLRSKGAYGVPLPMAFDPATTRPLEPDAELARRYTCDLSFLGAGYHNRVVFLPALFAQGLKLYGVNWPETPAFLEVMPEPNIRQSAESSNLIFNASRINLNLHSSPWCDGVNPIGDYLNPRTFELAGAGAFQLVDERRDLASSFIAGEELETYRDISECKKKVAYYLDHPDEREEIAARGLEKARAKHTYLHRMKDAMEALSAGPVPLFPRGETLPTVGSVLVASQSEPGLTRVLNRLEPDSVIDRDAITLAVAKGEGELSREEKLLLYMREIHSEVEFLNTAGQTE